MQKIFFRFNAGGMWGLGHLYRNVALIQEMQDRGYSPVAIINDFFVSKELLGQQNIEYLIVDEYESPEKIVGLIKENMSGGSPLLFFDRILSERFYIETLQKNGIKIVCYDDDSRNTFYADATINPRLYDIEGVALRYAGPSYQVLRQEVEYLASQRRTIHRKPEEVLIHFGGTDPMGILERTFRAIKKVSNIRFVMISGAAAYNESLSEEINSQEGFTYLRSTEHFAEALCRADLALLSGGVSLYEACAVGTPAITLAQNEDQKLTQRIFAEKAGVCDLGMASEYDFGQLRDTMLSILGQYARRKTMSRKGKKFVMPGGIGRICDVLEETLSNVSDPGGNK